MASAAQKSFMSVKLKKYPSLQSYNYFFPLNRVAHSLSPSVTIPHNMRDRDHGFDKIGIFFKVEE